MLGQGLEMYVSGKSGRTKNIQFIRFGILIKKMYFVPLLYRYKTLKTTTTMNKRLLACAKTFTAIFLFTVFFFPSLYAQQVWEYAPNTDSGNVVFDMISLDNGNIVTTGWSNHHSATASNQVHITVLSPDGELLAEHFFGGPNSDSSRKIIQTNDGGFLVTGITRSFSDDQNMDIYLLKLDSEFNLAWVKLIGGDYLQYAHHTLELSNGDLLVAGARKYGTEIYVGNLNDNVYFDSMGYLIRLNANGDILWERDYDHLNQIIYKTIEKEDGSIVYLSHEGIPGTANYYNHYNTKILLSNVQGNDGTPIWTKTHFPEINYDSDDYPSVHANDFIATETGYLIVGMRDPSAGSGKAYFLKTDMEGNMLSEKNLLEGSSEAHSIAETYDRNYVVLGDGNSILTSQTRDVFIQKISPFGGELWFSCYSSQSQQNPAKILESEDKGILAGGSQVIASNFHSRIFKLNPEGNLAAFNPTDYTESIAGNLISPEDAADNLVAAHTLHLPAPGNNVNLFKDELPISNPNQSPISYQVFNINGVLMQSGKINSESMEWVNTNSWSAGMYILSMKTKEEQLIKQQLYKVK